jgi:two-component system, LytTR family, response regulator
VKNPGASRLRALIVDDEALARQRLASMLSELGEIHVVAEADGGSPAVEASVRYRPDLVFLDVQMPGLDGFGVLRCTAGAHRPVVIFVTAHDEHAIRAFEVHAADYLLKPVSSARLREAVRRAAERVGNLPRAGDAGSIDALLARVPETPASSARIPVRRADGTTFVNVAEITWAEADGDHVVLHASGTDHTVRDTMAEMEAKLEPFRFMRVHRSAIVNVDAVRSVASIAKGDYTIVLRDGARVRSGRSYREHVQSLLRRGT